MQYLLLCAAILLPGSLAFPGLEQNNTGFENVKAYLDRFFPLFTNTQNLSLEDRIREMQRFFRLPVTGNLNPETEEIMKQPRCGMPDVADYSTFPGSPKWEKTDLTYKILNYTPDLRRKKVVRAIRRAFRVWGNVTPLKFRRVYRRQAADINILFAYYVHGDRYPFDGRGGTLAHAFAPGEGLGGDAHFDESERWSETNQDINLFLVAAHEFGHSLGLGHSDDREALMYPIYSYQNPKTFKLSDDDRRGIQSLYGKKSSNS